MDRNSSRDSVNLGGCIIISLAGFGACAAGVLVVGWVRLRLGEDRLCDLGFSGLSDLDLLFVIDNFPTVKDILLYSEA